MKTTLILTASLLTISGAHAETLQSAKVTTKVNDVRVYQPQKSGRQPKLGDRISGHTSVQTGRRSRTELTFQDKTITRLGANSTFSFRRGSRDINLNRGSILLQVPKSAGGATIRTATVTAVSEVTLLRINQIDFREIVGRRPLIARGIVRVLCQRLRNENLAQQKAKARK